MKHNTLEHSSDWWSIQELKKSRNKTLKEEITGSVAQWINMLHSGIEGCLPKPSSVVNQAQGIITQVVQSWAN